MVIVKRLLANLTGIKPRYWEYGEYHPSPVKIRGAVAIILTGGIGDSLLALPLLTFIRELAPDSKIIAVSKKLNREILRHCPVVDEYINFPAVPSLDKIWRIARKLRSENIEVIVGTLPSNLRSHSLLVKLTGVSRVIKHLRHYDNPRDDWQFWFSDLVKEYDDRHNLMANLDLLGPLGINSKHLETRDIESRLQITISPDEKSKALGRLQTHGARKLYVGFHPGCKLRWEFKRWQPRKYAQLADRIYDTWNAGLIWFGGPDEVGVVDEIMCSMDADSVSYTGTLDLRDAAALISVCDYFVSNDSGLMHVAAAVGTPVIGLFSNNNPRNNYRKTGPFGSHNIVVSDGELSELSVEKVFSLIHQELSQII